MNPNDYRKLLESGFWFKELPEELKQALLDAGIIKHFRQAGRLFSRGDEFNGLYAVLKGSIQITGISENGKESVLIVLESPNWFGEIALLDNKTRTHDAFTEEDTELLWISHSHIKRILAERPEWWREFGLLLAFKLRLAFVAIESIATLPATVRVARWLMLIANRYGLSQEDNHKIIKVQQQQLALMVSVSRQTTNQILKKMEAQGLIKLSYGEIEILDIENLRKVSDRFKL
ncbi:MAG: Crp/Fnr family transcriptional regulator [Thalassolituus sp.]|nr:Crp/Fnr family transcriptional regulator [Pseudomonadales bacterium]TNC85369.1 MAG: Crp/Fnr family transcriptional regulator [Thalassolituus sp.]HAG95447.1 Crp/Fnr family transcriptional regulator [Gammaproteobacteria bacterium]HAU13111.1 Crp/Fnr family transcriptional regulator [Gammaproteobacteria bacterium]HBO92994.1 Crp/Fnr family transcriptional regulator [Gammaproteobacteria bacterium]|tara:strand:- start:197 stop:895 length:699 start_codon:yes stop_codon:yes gene_type:complete